VISDAIRWCLLSVIHAIVSNYAYNAQAIVAKYACTSRRLCEAVRFKSSPLFYCCLISKKRERQDLPRFVQTFEPFNGYKPVNLIQERP